MRVLVTGVGGVLGTRVAMLLAADRRVDALAGTDLYVPRRPVPSMTFTEVDPRDRRRLIPAVEAFEPTAIVHLGIYEPDARSTPRLAHERTSANTLAVLGVAAELGTVDRIVVRSGLEVYGRSRGSASVPDETVPPHPTTTFGRSLLEVDRLASAAAEAAGVPAAVVRLAPVVGPHVPSPLARYLRLPIVPVSALSDPAFSVLHVEDAARAVVAALFRAVDDTVNVVAPGAVTVWQAARLGGRVPVPLLGPEWRLVRRLADLAGAPLPDHVTEVIHRGRTADGGRAESVLGVELERTTRQAVEAVQHGEPVPLRLVEEDEAA
ncbi:MAG: NAD-dependent epimerase/dehydratase family protein [Acidimicrobiales bacterium]